jgi:hypothetical protein
MTDKHKGNGHKTETPDVSHIRNVEVTHETSDVSVHGVLLFVVILTLATGAVSFGMWGLFNYFAAQEAKEPTRGPMALTDKELRLPPEPRLQSAPGFRVTLEDGTKVKLERTIPQAEYRELRKQWDENLNTGLKDSKGNVVGMPIKDAMEKIVSSGLPSRVKGPGGKLSDYAVSLPTASSSGREVEKRLQ